MNPQLTDRSIQYVILEMKKGWDTRTVAKEVRVTQRHVQRLWAEYLKSGVLHVQRPAGRPKASAPSDAEVRAVLDSHERRPEGVLRTTRRLREKGYDISYFRAYQSTRFGSAQRSINAGIGKPAYPI